MTAIQRIKMDQHKMKHVLRQMKGRKSNHWFQDIFNPVQRPQDENLFEERLRRSQTPSWLQEQLDFDRMMDDTAASRAGSLKVD